MIHEWTTALGAPHYLYWALRWGENGEESAKRAWEAAMRHAHNTHCWRLKEPMIPPHRFNSVVAVGDEPDGRTSLERMLMAAQRVGGSEFYVLADDFVRALVMRRHRLMVERLQTGDFGLKVIRDEPRSLDRQGRMKPHE